jgi:hypothetical protein
MSLRHGMDLWRCNRVSRCSVMRESPSQDNRTSHWSRHGEHQKSLWKRWPMVTLCLKHKNVIGMIHLRGRSGEDSILNGERPSCMARIREYCKRFFCVPGGTYRPEFLKLNSTRIARHYPGQWQGCGNLCPYESVTPKPCSWPGGPWCYVTHLFFIKLKMHILWK